LLNFQLEVEITIPAWQESLFLNEIVTRELDPTGTPSDIYNVNITVSDDDTGIGSSSSVTVNNVAPVVTAVSVSGMEGSSVTESASFTDAGTADTHTCSIDWGDSSNSAGIVNESDRTCSSSHTYVDNGSYTVTVNVTDDDTGVGSDSDTATIENAKPVVAAPSWQNLQVSCRQTSTLNGISVTDAGVKDFPWSVNVDWGDGSTDIDYNTNTQDAQGNQTHTYNTPGTYNATVTVTDKDSGSGSNTSSKLTVLQTYTINFLQPFDESSPSNLITNTMKSGRVVPVKVTIYDVCAQADVTDPAAVVKIFLSTGTSNGTANDAVEVYADAGYSNSNTLNFRWISDSTAPSGGFWIYNLDSKTA
jgi:PKD repeat protein